MSSVWPDFVKYPMFKMRGRGLGRTKRGVNQSEVRISNAIFEENSRHEVMIQTPISEPDSTCTVSDWTSVLSEDTPYCHRIQRY
jgi:hypothetical protein